jgi:hypothetical protein
MFDEIEKINETIFNDYSKYNTNNKLKCYIISKLKEIAKNSNENIMENIKKTIIPYLIEKRELKITYNNNDYNIEFIEKLVNSVNVDENLYYRNQTYLVESDDSDEESLI